MTKLIGTKWIFLACAVAALFARGGLFSEGGTVGAWLSVVLFWFCIGMFLLAWLLDTLRDRQQGQRAGVAMWSLGTLSAATFAIGGFSDDRTIETISSALFLVGLLGLLLLAIVTRIWDSRA